MTQQSADELSRLSPAVADLVRTAPGTYVDGQWKATSDDTVDVVSPGTGATVATVVTSGTAGVRQTVAAARRTFDEGSWATSSPRERARLLRSLAAVIRAHADDFAALGVIDVGTPISLSRGLHAAAPAAYFDFFADAAERGPLGGYEEGLGLHHGPPNMSMSNLYRVPIGVVAAISAYNYPLLISAFKIGGALAAGCTAVLMPSPQTLTASLLLMRCIEEAGFPPGVVNLVTGGADVGRALTESDGVDLVTFTGSVPVGKNVMRQAADGLKKVVLELGGKSPNLVLPSADLDAIVEPSVLRFTRNAGQGCGSTTRTLVPREWYDAYAARAADVMSALPVGDPWDEATAIGPLISAPHRARVRGYVDRAVESGAMVLAGSFDAVPGDGFFMNPLLVGGVRNDAEISQEELFGPVGVLLPYDSVDEAVAIANATRFGLNGNIWGTTSEALEIAGRVRAGTVTVNGGGADRPDAPWPGMGESGIGVDRGMEGFREFFDVKHVQFRV
ncbi:aldehyde dehydrogenase family protein [Nocardioides sediminis]|uniref:aldehyde dehydrogenase family protein n=1 Tax=Nocardioides sediminis TaxID=433648 RepID=UPI00131EF70E|nr:aldehyde dehydrogenase family protein [Nocardioides sediminis]